MKGRWWVQPLVGALAAFVFFLPFLYIRDFEFASLVYLAALLVASLAIVIGILLRRVLAKRWVSGRFVLAVAIFWAVTTLMFWRTDELRPWARWAVASQSYRDAVLRREPDPETGLRHMQWDGWGFVGMDTSVELVYDPSDSLAREVKQNPNGRFASVAARAAKIQRLGQGWYSVTLYTSKVW